MPILVKNNNGLLKIVKNCWEKGGEKFWSMVMHQKERINLTTLKKTNMNSHYLQSKCSIDNFLFEVKDESLLLFMN